MLHPIVDVFDFILPLTDEEDLSDFMFVMCSFYQNELNKLLETLHLCCLFLSMAHINLSAMQLHKSCFKFSEDSVVGKENSYLLKLPIECYLNGLHGPLCIWHLCHAKFIY